MNLIVLFIELLLVSSTILINIRFIKNNIVVQGRVVTVKNAYDHVLPVIEVDNPITKRTLKKLFRFEIPFTSKGKIVNCIIFKRKKDYAFTTLFHSFVPSVLSFSVLVLHTIVTFFVDLNNQFFYITISVILLILIIDFRKI